MKLVRFLLLLSCLGLLSCSNAPEDQNIAKEASYRLGYHEDGKLAGYFEHLRPPEVSDQFTGFHSLSSGDDALLARIALIESASQSLDLQYYIFSDDETSQIITWRLYEAAQRGVRVRVLLDDMQHRDDSIMARLHAHPNIEIRLFNPHFARTTRSLSFLMDFSRLNHRMHNKSLTADGVSSIVGGRNIGNEYFSFANSVEFGDFDLLLFGPVVAQTAVQFDTYWNSQHALPIDALVDMPPTEATSSLTELFAQEQLEAPFKDGKYDITQLALFEQLKLGTLDMNWGEGELWYDSPDKVETKASALAEKLAQRLKNAKHSVLLVSPYFVPTESGTKALTDAAERGIKITIVTNSLASNDVFAVHGWYAKYREALLKSGIELWEMKSSAEIKRQWSLIGSTRSSLHAKVILVDERDVIVGSMNWDPRSAELNTEMAVVIEHADYAKLALNQLRTGLSTGAFKVDLQNGAVIWRDMVTGDIHDNEPEASIWRRFGAWFSGILPIEGML
ncbi:phospholipase D family protein [Enterovibrio sp. 27052020O]|uniref:phospholipase D family protein n=1 Tax=Enterovibrio sp. 27052020O TaxID=3241166 RepID=UPI0038902CDE